MTLVLEMRDRLAAALQIELRNRGIASSADIAFAVADRALEGTQFEALTGYVGAVEAGEPPEAARNKLANDGIFDTILTLEP